MSQNNEIAKFMGQIAEGLGVIGAPSGGFAKVAIKARLWNSFTGKETKKISVVAVAPNGNVHGNSTLRNK
jgi:hypothetical protein